MSFGNRPLHTAENPRPSALGLPPQPCVRTPEDKIAVEFQISRLLQPLSSGLGGRIKRTGWLAPPQPRPDLSAEQKATFDALVLILQNPSLITPKMLLDAHASYAAVQAAEAQRKKEETERILREQLAREAAAAQALAQMQENGWP
jgi:hypothetical protein